jgi:hypothetical protein
LAQGADFASTGWIHGRAPAASGFIAATRLEDSAGSGSKGGDGDEARRQLHGDGEARQARGGAKGPPRVFLFVDLSLLRPSSAPPRGAPRWRRRRRAELHDGVGGRNSTARPASLPNAGAREGAECAGPAPADEGAPALLRIRRRWEVNAFLASSCSRPLRVWEREKSPLGTFPVTRCGWFD